MYIGNKIRTLRKEKGLSLLELSKKTRISSSLLSRIENEKRTGSLDNHMKIADALDVNITDLYKHLVKKKEPISKGNLRTKTDIFTLNNSATFNVLTKDAFSKKMTPILLKIDPKGQSITEQFKEGSERFIIVLEGKIEVHINNEI